MAGVRRTERLGAVLHLGHHRQAQGRPLQPPLDCIARLWRLAARRHSGVEPRHGLPGRADVPRLRLERALCRGDERREARASGSAPRWRQPLRAVRGRRRDDEPRRADGVARLRSTPRRHRRAMFELAPRAVRRRGGAAVADRGVRPARHRRHPGLGHDGDEPARQRRGAEGQASRPRPCGAAGGPLDPGPAGVRRRDEDRQRRGPRTAA